MVRPSRRDYDDILAMLRATKPSAGFPSRIRMPTDPRSSLHLWLSLSQLRQPQPQCGPRRTARFSVLRKTLASHPHAL